MSAPRPMGRSRRIILAMVLAADGRPPSLREMMAATGIGSPHGIECHLRALRDAGLVVWCRGKARTVRPTCRWVSVEELFAAEGPWAGRVG
jgi:SOS-response transcriptional repressor LexA